MIDVVYLIAIYQQYVLLHKNKLLRMEMYGRRSCGIFQGAVVRAVYKDRENQKDRIQTANCRTEVQIVALCFGNLRGESNFRYKKLKLSD